MGKERSGRTQETPSAQPTIEKVSFLEWFVEATQKHEELKPHHMSALRTFFSDLSDREPAAAYDEALKRYGI
jgi:hypothetical protein